MAAISLASPTLPATDPAPAQPTSDEGRAFSSTFTDAAQKAAKPVAAKTQHSESKDKDRKDDTGDRQGDKDPAPAAATTVPTTAQATPAAPHSRDDKPADGKAPDGKDRTSRAVSASTAKPDGKSDDADLAVVDTGETPVDAAQLAPVLDALKQAASATQQAPLDTAAPTPPPQAPAPPVETAQVEEPLPATASLLAARVVPAAAQADAKPAAPAKKAARADAVADKAAAIDATATASAPDAGPHVQHTPDSATVTQPSAGQQLAAGGADRALDMAKQGAWLDGLSRDIAATGDSSSTLRFQAAPTNLGSVQVEIARGLEGAAVTLTASNEGARSVLADAKPQLIAEARAQGIHIASAQVDVSTDSRQSNTGSQPDPRHDPRGQTSFSSQTGGEGSPNRQSQTRSQPFAINQTAESQPAATAEAEETAASAAPTGGMYA